MYRLTFHSEYIDTLDLFFKESISDLRLLGCEVHMSSVADSSLFNSASELYPFRSKYFFFLSPLFRRSLQAFIYLLKFSNKPSDSVSILVTPVLIIAAPFVSLIRRFNYIVVSQGQLEGEGLFVSYLYRLLLIFSIARANFSFSCNLLEKFRWDFFPFVFLKLRLKTLPWYGVCLSRSKLSFYRTAVVNTSSDKLTSLCYLGRISESKGCSDLIRIFSHPLLSKFSLTLAGPIENDRSILSLISNLPSNILLRDSLVPNDIPAWISSFDLYITLSRGESIGASTLEALMCGKPVISSLNSGSCQVLRHSVDSFLLDDFEPVSILTAIDYCQRNYTSMSSSARQLSSLTLPTPSYLSSSILKSLADA